MNVSHYQKQLLVKTTNDLPANSAVSRTLRYVFPFVCRPNSIDFVNLALSLSMENRKITPLLQGSTVAQYAMIRALLQREKEYRVTLP